jgi:hypothetical protein
MRFAGSTADAKGAIGRLDFNVAFVLTARRKPKCAAGGFNGNVPGPLVGIIDELVELDSLGDAWSR